jgi:hypothetical protein
VFQAKQYIIVSVTVSHRNHDIDPEYLIAVLSVLVRYATGVFSDTSGAVTEDLSTRLWAAVSLERGFTNNRLHVQGAGLVCSCFDAFLAVFILDICDISSNTLPQRLHDATACHVATYRDLCGAHLHHKPHCLSNWYHCQLHFDLACCCCLISHLIVSATFVPAYSGTAHQRYRSNLNLLHNLPTLHSHICASHSIFCRCMAF